MVFLEGSDFPSMQRNGSIGWLENKLEFLTILSKTTVHGQSIPFHAHSKDSPAK